MSHDIFLISSFDPIPKHFFAGYCFQDEDFILGSGGYDRYRAARNRGIEPGQDGAYVIVRSSGNETVVGTDFSGYFKLFLYEHPNGWALSNSLIDLARFAAGKGLPVTIDEAHLASFFIRDSFGQQLTSLHTSVKDIRLVPSMMEVVITRSISGAGISLRPTAMISRMASQGDYATVFSDFMRLWVGRMATILRSDLRVQCDLSGGRDSRAVLALIIAASKRFGGDLQKIGIQSNPRAVADRAAADRLMEEYGLSFTGRGSSRRPEPSFSAARAYEKWKSLCLGVYAPIYFPQWNRSSTSVNFSGGGGESHRRFYEKASPERLLDGHRRSIPSRALFEQLRADILNDLAFLSRGPEGHLKPLIVHYRHFRDRCHGGCLAQYRNRLSPLASGLLRQASTLCSPEQFDRSQVLADIMMNADEKLAFMPYDDPKKALDPRHVAERIDSSGAIAAARGDGRVFAADEAAQETGTFVRPDALRMLRDDFLTNYERVRGSGFFPHQYLEKARMIVEEAVRSGSLQHAAHGCSVSHVILTGELSNISGGNLKGNSSGTRLLKNLLLRLKP
jgi:hypothetical protein